MSGIENLPVWAALPVALLLILGGCIVLIGALGLMRLPSFYQRIHGPAITITLGAGCILIASMIYFTVAQSRPVVHELLISAFTLLTAPVVAMLLMRAAVYRNLRVGTPVWDLNGTGASGEEGGGARTGGASPAAGAPAEQSDDPLLQLRDSKHEGAGQDRP
jgi:multicomponent K+:H+ antiporter subunit G